MRYSKEEKLRLMGMIQESGLPIKRACKQVGISDASYYSWRKELSAPEKSASNQSTEKETKNTESTKMLLALKKRASVLWSCKANKTTAAHTWTALNSWESQKDLR